MSATDKPVTIFVCPGGCFCECGTGGHCEHVWDGWKNDADGRGGSVICTRCGISAMSHDARVLP